MLRVIGGSAKGRRLKRVPGDSTRPVMDRVKENLFNIISMDVYTSRWLDLFAGTGQVAIEALSRGAEYATFVDNNRRAISTIHQNIQITGFEDKSEVFQRDALDYLKQFDGDRYDYIYVAPPQYHEIWRNVLTAIDEMPGHLLYPEGYVIVQIDPLEWIETELENLVLEDRRKYGNTELIFYQVANQQSLQLS